MSAISLFSGCGGDTLGLERAGFKVVAFNEFKKWAVDTHNANFPSSILLQGEKGVTDITKVPDSVFTPYKGKVDIVFAGFNCQGFSKAGKKDPNDSRNQMFRHFVRVAKCVEPSFVIGENVTGLLKMRSGPKDSDPLMIDLIRTAFAEIGYTMTHQVLEANEFGVPQKRKRIVLVGWRTGISLDPASFWAGVNAWGATRPVVKLSSFVKPSLEGALELLPAAVPPDFAAVALAIPEDAVVSGTPHPYIVLKANAFGQTYDEKTHDRLLSCGKRDSPIHSEILDLNQDSKTIICTYDHQPRLLVGLLKPSGKAYARCLLPDELKQIQGFPADFLMRGSLKEQVVQIGNAVPPALIEAVARQLLLMLPIKNPVKVFKAKNLTS
jgi:DNA (cytosine-5)-methyltransferase 1